MASMIRELRRCLHLLFEPVHVPRLDLRALASGDGPLLHTWHGWRALAAHLDAPVWIDVQQMQRLGQLDPGQWLAFDAGDTVLSELLASGLVLERGDRRACAAVDKRLREAHWWGPAAVLHRQSRWHGHDSAAAAALHGMERMDGLIGLLGCPPPSGAAAVDQSLALPAPDGSPLAELMARRVTCRNFDGQRGVSLPVLSALLWRALGEQAQVRHPSGAVFAKKGSPSAGGLHPTEAYLLLRRVDGLADGFYHYLADGHRLQPLPAAAGQQTGAGAALDDSALRWLSGQAWFADAPVLIVLASRFGRLQWKYRNHSKAYRAAVLDVGHLSQSLYLAATELGLGAFVTAAINEGDIEQDLRLCAAGDGPLAVAGVGWRSAQMTTTEMDPAGAVWAPAG